MALLDNHPLACYHRLAESSVLSEAEVNDEELIEAIKNSKWGNPQMRQAYNMAVDECAAVICGGCQRAIPLDFGRHQVSPGHSYPCISQRLLALKIT